MDSLQLRNILESCLLVAGKALSLAQLELLFDEDIDRPERNEIKEALLALQESYAGRGIELVEVASGWRLQSAASMEHWVGRLFEEKQPRYSRALLETLVLIAYRQPITRGEIEEVRGVAVSSNIIRTLQEREWIKEMGFKDVPGKPALWGTTKAFLDYFNLKRLDELPTLAEARDLAEIDAALAAEIGVVEGGVDGVAANDSQGMDDESGDDESGGVEGSGVEGSGVEGSDVEGSDAEGSDAEGSDAEGSDVEANDVEGSDVEGSEVEANDVEGSDDLGSDTEGIELENIDPVGNEVEGIVAEGSDNKSSDVRGLDVSGSEFKGVNAEGNEVEELDVASSDVESVEAGVSDEIDSDIVELAGSLEMPREPTEQPAFSALVDQWDSSEDDRTVTEKASGNTDSSDEEPLTSSESSTDIQPVSGSDSDDDRPAVQPSEVSADDLDISEWKAPTSRESVEAIDDNNGTDGTTGGDSVSTSTENSQPQAESDLRRVIDDFAEEHQQQLDAENNRPTNSTNVHDVPAAETAERTADGTVSKSAPDEIGSHIEQRPVTSEDDDEGRRSKQSYGLRGTLFPDEDVDTKSHEDPDTSKDFKNSYGSGEP